MPPSSGAATMRVVASRSRPTGDQLLAQAADGRARAAAHLHRRGAGRRQDLFDDRGRARGAPRRHRCRSIGFVETHGRAETEAKLARSRDRSAAKDSTIAASCSRKWISTRSSPRKPQLCMVDELAHTNAPGSRHAKRYQDVLELLEAGIGVMTAVNIQHLETLNDAVGRVTGVRVRETVPDTFLDRADEVVNVDVTVQELQTQAAAGQGLSAPRRSNRRSRTSFARRISRRCASWRYGPSPTKSARRPPRSGSGRPGAGADPRTRDGLYELERAAPRVLRTGARIAGRLGARWYAVYVETPREAPGHIEPRRSRGAAAQHRAGRELGATVVRVRADKPADGLIAFAKREGITHVMFGQTARSRWEILLKGSTLNRFLEEVRDATVQVVSLNEAHV